MKKWAIVENGLVVNVILWDGVSHWEPEEGQIVIEVNDDIYNEIGIGWTYEDGVLSPPPQPEDESTKID